MNDLDWQERKESTSKVFQIRALCCIMCRLFCPMDTCNGCALVERENVVCVKRGGPYEIWYHCDIGCGTLMEDGRFALLMAQEHEDLNY